MTVVDTSTGTRARVWFDPAGGDTPWCAAPDPDTTPTRHATWADALTATRGALTGDRRVGEYVFADGGWEINGDDQFWWGYFDAEQPTSVIRPFLAHRFLTLTDRLRWRAGAMAWHRDQRARKAST